MKRKRNIQWRFVNKPGRRAEGGIALAVRLAVGFVSNFLLHGASMVDSSVRVQNSHDMMGGLPGPLPGS